MKQYKYTAINSEGKQQDGILSAENELSAMEQLQKMNLSPLQFEESLDTSKSNGKRAKIKKKDIAHFTSQMSALLIAGLPLAKALKSLEEQTENLTMQDMLNDILDGITTGLTFAESLNRYPKLFTPLYISMIEAGEISGSLEMALERIDNMMAKDQEIVSKLKAALTYPLVMVSVMILSVCVLLTFVVPRFAGIFKDLGATLPLPTRILLGISGAFENYWWAMLLIIGGLIYGLIKYNQTKEGKYKIDNFKLNIPYLGPMTREIILSRFAATLSSLLISGVPILDALVSTGNVVDNLPIKKMILAIVDDIKNGISFANAMKNQSAFFPPLMVGMVGTGEQSGEIPEMLKNAGEYYTKEADAKTQVVTTLLEPIIIVVMGLIVGFIIMAILLPIFEMQSSVK